MNDLIQAIIVEGDLLSTCVNLLVLFFAFDCIIGFGYAIKTVKESVS